MSGNPVEPDVPQLDHVEDVETRSTAKDRGEHLKTY